MEKKLNIERHNKTIAFCSKIRFILLIAICLFTKIITTSSQQINIDLIKLNCKAANFEKVYVHIASPSVSAGGNFLYKAYLSGEAESTSKENSNILYFDFIDWKNQVVFHWKSNLKERELSGRVTIPDTISTGIYQFRAYSNWMLNNGFNYTFQTPVLIYNFRDENLQTITRVAYKNNLLNRVESNSRNNIEIKTIYQNNTLKIDIIDTLNFLNFENSFSLIGFQSDKLVFNRKIIKQNTKNLVEKITDLKSGNLGIFLIDRYSNILARHYTLIDSNNEPELVLNTDFNSSLPNKNIQLNFNCKNLEHDEKLFLSCAIREKDFIVPFESQFRIDKYFHFFSEIDASAWYDSSINSTFNLLSEKNWIWSDYFEHGILNCNYTKENNRSLIRGRVINSKTNKPLENNLILASYSNDKPIFDYCNTNSNGEFFFWLNEYYNNKKIYFLALQNDTLPHNIHWKISSNINANQQLLQNHLEKLTETQQKYLKKLHQIEMVNQIYYKQEVKTEKYKTLSDSVYRYIPDITVYPNEYIDLVNFQEIADNILPGVFFKKKKSNWEIKIYNSDYRDNLNVGGTIFLNGIPFYDYDHVANIKKGSIEKIEIYRNNLCFGNINFNGIIAVYTKDKDIPDAYSNQPGVMTVYHHVTQTEESSINAKKNQIENFPNFERILYWNSTLSPEEQNFELNFRSSELKTVYIIDIEGVTSKGRCISYQHEFSVE